MIDEFAVFPIPSIEEEFLYEKFYNYIRTYHKVDCYLILYSKRRDHLTYTRVAEFKLVAGTIDPVEWYNNLLKLMDPDPEKEHFLIMIRAPLNFRGFTLSAVNTVPQTPEGCQELIEEMAEQCRNQYGPEIGLEYFVPGLYEFNFGIYKRIRAGQYEYDTDKVVILYFREDFVKIGTDMSQCPPNWYLYFPTIGSRLYHD